MTVASEVAGVIPAAGASTRMGRTKALLEIGGVTFVRRVVHALREGGCDPVYVVTSGDSAVSDEARSAGATVLVNPDPGEGPITSLRLALGALHATTSGVACLPIDHPLVTPGVVHTLLDEARISGSSLTLPEYRGKRGHPAIFRRTLFEELLDPALEGGARTVVHRHLQTARVVATSDRGVVIDVDTPDAYQDAIEYAADRVHFDSGPET